ncbi:MAG: helix-turn-helix transcriptional regulator, partial [Saccharofermentanales bacterium]
IYSFAKHYSDMYFVRSGDAVLKSLYGDMKAIRMEVAYPFLLKAHDDCDKGLITIEELREILRLCVSYVLRRAVCDIPTNSLNKTFATMKNDIRQFDYLNSVKTFFILLDSYKGFPNDKRFLDTFLTRDIYHFLQVSVSHRAFKEQNTERLMLESIDSICKVINCKVDDILDFVPDHHSAEGCGWIKNT